MTHKHVFARAAVLAVAGLLFWSCATVKNSSYLQDLAYDTAYSAQAAPELILQEGDRLDIQVLSESPELSAPFHIAAAETLAPDVYTIDKDGEIDFPVLGTMKLAGLTLKATERLIAAKIRESGYIKSPTVRVILDNFTVTVIGQSGNAVLPVKDNSINLLQAIAATGGIRNNSNIQEVTVIRTEKGTRTAYEVNLQTRELFDSPAFYLQQNDIIYLKPKGVALSTSGQTAMSFVTAGLSLVSIISNFILWSSRF